MNRDGIGLAEAMIALAVLGFAAIAAIGAAATQIDAGRRARLHLQASVLADYTMEQLRLLPADGLDRIAREPRTGRFDPPFAAFAWDATVLPIHDLHQYELRVRVQHPDIETTLIGFAHPRGIEER